jgi:terminase small subunit-like protein
MVEISVDSSLTPEDRRIRIDTLKWLLSKLAPKKYGDLLHLQHSATIDYAAELESARKRRVVSVVESVVVDDAPRQVIDR